MPRAADYEALLRAAIRHDNTEVWRLGRLAVSTERAAGRVAVANTIDRILRSAGGACQQPLMTLGRSNNPAVVGVEPRRRMEDLVVTPLVRGLLADLFAEQRAGEQLAEAGLPPASRVLLHGPPGLGKTSLAHAIAAELGLPLLEVLLEAVVDSHLGESSKNLAEVWKFVMPQRCVLLLDEFDSLCMRRTTADSGAAQETSRLTSTVLRGLEQLPWTVLVIACTNLRGNLDDAVFRRFHHHIEMPVPDEPTLMQYVRTLRGKYAVTLPFSTDVGTTFAEAEMAVQAVARKEIIARCAK